MSQIHISTAGIRNASNRALLFIYRVAGGVRSDRERPVVRIEKIAHVVQKDVIRVREERLGSRVGCCLKEPMSYSLIWLGIRPSSTRQCPNGSDEKSGKRLLSIRHADVA